MNDGEMTPEQAVRLLRAKNGQLENKVLQNARYEENPHFDWGLTADVALLFSLLADHIERTEVQPLPLATQQRLGGHANISWEMLDSTIPKIPWGPDHPGYDEMGQ